jgi:AAA domain-containing protein
MDYTQNPESISALIRRDLPLVPCWIEPAILPKRGKCLFGGQAKTGKSFVMLELARALATGSKPFDHPAMTIPRVARVLLCEQELGPYGLQKRAKLAYAKEDLQKLDDCLWYISKQPQLKLDTQKGREYLLEVVDKVQPNVILLDPIGKMHHYEENDNAQISRLFTAIDALLKAFEQNDLSIIISHHFGKPSTNPQFTRDPLDPYNFRGASKWFDDPDTLITMARLGNLQTAHQAWFVKSRTVTRQGEELPDTMYTVNKNNDLRVIYEGEVADPVPVSSTAGGFVNG